jgi:hypothetical protein
MVSPLRRAALRRTVTAATIAVTAVALPAAPAFARPHHRTSTIRHETHHDVSRPLAQMTAAPLRDEPGENEPIRRMPNSPRGSRPDPVVQRANGPHIPGPSANFEGIGQGFSGPSGNFSVTGIPPDTNAAVGTTQVVEIVNTAFAVFGKGGAVLFGPAATNTLWSDFGGACQTTNDGDGVVRYDALADRWVITQFANVGSAAGPFFECVAVSRTGDAMGMWNRYSFQYASFPDYPKLSVWPDAYYTTYNLFNPAGTAFLGAEICAMDRAAMLAGTAAMQQCFTTTNQFGGLLAADVEGGMPPPAGEANTVVALGTTETTLAFWKFHVDWATPTNSTFTGPGTLTVAPYTTACGASGTCIPQGGIPQTLDALSDRVMFRLAYRNFGDHESLVVNHAVTAAGTTGVRWYELRQRAGGTPNVFQQGTYAPDAAARWMGSVDMDKVGNIALGYSASSSTLAPQVRYTGRLAGDPLGELPQGEATIVAGNGSQTSFSRWGDYSSMVVDPTDGCTFWYANEYLANTGVFNWHTRLASFQLPGCASNGGNDFTMSVDPPAGSAPVNGSVTTTVATSAVIGSAETVTFGTTSLPPGVSATFTPPSVTAGGTATMRLTTSASTPVGNFGMSVTGVAPSAMHAVPFTVSVVPDSGAVVNGTFESGLSGWTVTGSAAAVSDPVHTGLGAAIVGALTPTHESTLSQTFTVRSGQNELSLWYLTQCPDIIQLDWFTITLRDNTSGTTTTLLPNICDINNTYQRVTASVSAGHNYTLNLINHDDNATGDATRTFIDDVVVASAPAPTVTNGGFESGLSGWTRAGSTARVSSPVHGGANAARIGSTSPSRTSSLAQTFTVQSGQSQLSLWYRMTCRDPVTSDWFTVTLTDTTTGTTTTPLGRTCATSGSFLQVTAPVIVGHTYRITMTNRDNHATGRATFTVVDDVAVT